jgi:hypothetical protein
LSDNGESGGGMPNQLQRIIVFSSRRYNENRDNRPRLARAYLAIVNKATDVQLSTNNVGDLLDFLYEPQTDPDLAKAARDVLERVGTAPEN